MNTVALTRRKLIVTLAVGTILPVWGCDSGTSSDKPAPLKEEENKKSSQASGDFYKQKFQQKKQ